MLDAFVATIALAGVPAIDAAPTDFVAYRVDYRIGDVSTVGDPKYVVHTPFNSLTMPLDGGVPVPAWDGMTLKVRMVPLGGHPWSSPVRDEFQFDRGRVRLLRTR